MREMGLGRPVPRTEDLQLLRGLGRYTDDIVLPREARLYILRSPHAAARIRRIDTAAAQVSPGVLAVLTGDDLVRGNLGNFPSRMQRQRADGSPNLVPPYRALAVERVQHVGEAVAGVIAETLNQAKDAAELIEVEYEILPAVTAPEAATAPGSPAVWESVPDNICFVHRVGDRRACEQAFERAHHVARETFRITRITANSMEGRTALASYDRREDRFTLYSGIQAPHGIRQEIAAVFKLPANRFRVISPDVGGGFGMKGGLYPEVVVALFASRLLDRPVKWIAERSEALISDHQARDNVSTVELALDREGKFLALRVQTLANLGAYLGLNTTLTPVNNIGGLAGVYTIGAMDVTVTGVFSNTLPTSPYRGAGRPEASYCTERIIDKAAREMEIDRIELRRRNLIPAEAMPYKTALVYTYDSGEFEAVMNKCLELADWSGFEARRREARARGKLRGIGLASVIEIAGGPHDRPMEEGAEIRFDASGSATVLMGSHNHGQGHETVFRQMAAEFLGLPFDKVRVTCGDTDAVYHGRGTFGSRTMAVGGTAFLEAARKVIERGKEIAAHLLEASALDIEFTDGRFTVAGTDRGIEITELAKASFLLPKMPKGMELGLQGGAVIAPSGASFPNGCHICEVEIDPETGTARLVAYSVVDDVGRVVNPLLLKGQIHGGIAQGAGQALLERIAYDESGQVLSGSFMDYGMPRADDFPSIRIGSHDVPCKNNPLGVKGAGEAGTVGALPAVMSAVADALLPLGITDVEMPASPERIWRALQQAPKQH
ncbi:MAG TPA: xanthine dehydrogenase family protein molybdopterin-binding subunit [Stellaceae bacterium]|nr:xanthine dehydrogenase family protein molybdopterin-binding subunit [Stellaceae bacterium]